MSDTPTFGVCWSTIMRADFNSLVDAVSSAGLNTFGLRPGLYLDKRKQGVGDAELRALVDERGLKVSYIDPLMGALPGVPDVATASPLMAELLSYTVDDCIAAAEAFSADTIAVAQPGGRDAGLQEMTDAIGAIATRLGEHDLDVAIEFIANSGGIGSLDRVLEIIEGVGLPNVKVMLDTWHIHRTGIGLDRVAALSASRIAALQISDALESQRGVMPKVMEERRLPGEGEMDLAALIDTVLEIKPDIDISVEVFSSALDALPASEIATRVADSMSKVMKQTRLGTGG